MLIERGVYKEGDAFEARAWVRGTSRHLGYYTDAATARGVRDSVQAWTALGVTWREIRRRIANGPRLNILPPGAPPAMSLSLHQGPATKSTQHLADKHFDLNNPGSWSGLRTLLAYNPQTGAITRKDSPNADLFTSQQARSHWIGAAQRNPDKDITQTRVKGESRRFVRVMNCIRLPAERLAWGLGTGDITTENIGFHDGNPGNLILDNLYPLDIE